MCTVTWRKLPDGLELYFNRDERRTRQSAAPPTVGRAGETQYLAPSDGDFGGSWIAVNDRGLLVCLLNGYAARDLDVADDPAAYVSRGCLPLHFMDCRSAQEALERLDELDPEPFRSFVLAVLDDSGPRGAAFWDLEGYRVDRGPDALALPWVSSSFRTAEVGRSRRERFVELQRTHPGSPGEIHRAYHAAHLPERGAFSPCMHRPDAKTVSFSLVTITPDRVRFGYVPHSPCRGLPGETIDLPRADRGR